MFVSTFYSFRGGVGRTTALVNVGFELARRGRNVLLVDFDLESPALTDFPRLQPDNLCPGIVEYVAAYRDTGESPDVSEYLYSVETENQKGHIWVLPAGRGDREYWEALAGIDWQEFYDRQDGYLLFEDTRLQWERRGVHYVLIDTHAGITPTLGIATRQLADATVIMFNPHQAWNRSLNQQAGIHLQMVSDWIAEEAMQTGRTIEQLEVPSLVVEADEVPHSWDGFSDESVLHSPTAIPFSHQLLRGKLSGNPKEIIVVADASDGRLVRAYRQLTNALVVANFAHDADGAKVALCQIHADPRKAVGFHGLREHFDQLETIIDSFHDNPEIQAQAACCLFAARRWNRALECLDQAIEHDPDSRELLWQRASYRVRVGMKDQAVLDLVRLLELGTRPQASLSPEDWLKNLVPLPGFTRPRFALPEEFEVEMPKALSDYCESLIDVSGVDTYVASAFRWLRLLDAEKYEQASKSPYITHLPSETRLRLLADQLPDLEDARLYRLVRSREWAAVVELLQPLVEESDWCRLEDAILLFMAWWGLGNEQQLRACGKKAIERFDQLLAHPGPPSERDAPLGQMMAIILWKADQKDFAGRILDVIEEDRKWPEDQQIFSYWHFDWVIWRRFKEDCKDIRQMLKGALIQPPFLGRRPAYR